jgi:Uma2 family endonuclease
MSVQTRPPPASADFGINDVGRISVDAWHDLIAAGRFGKEDPYELLEGLIVKKIPEDPIHAAVIYALLGWFSKHLPDGFTVRGPAPMTSDDSEPEPDLLIARGRPLDYADHHPRPDETVLMIEVAHTSLRQPGP